MKDHLDKIFVNCNRIEEDKAKRILNSKDDLSVKNYDWNIPLDLFKMSSTDNNRFETFIGMGKRNHENPKYRKKFICIAKKGELIYLSKRIVRIMYNSMKNDAVHAKEEQ